MTEEIVKAKDIPRTIQDLILPKYEITFFFEPPKGYSTMGKFTWHYINPRSPVRPSVNYAWTPGNLVDTRLSVVEEVAKVIEGFIDRVNTGEGHPGNNPYFLSMFSTEPPKERTDIERAAWLILEKERQHLQENEYVDGKTWTIEDVRKDIDYQMDHPIINRSG